MPRDSSHSPLTYLLACLSSQIWDSIVRRLGVSALNSSRRGVRATSQFSSFFLKAATVRIPAAAFHESLRASQSCRRFEALPGAAARFELFHELYSLAFSHARGATALNPANVHCICFAREARVANEARKQ